MKIDRQIGILSILLQRHAVTAPYLADKFEVSRRTINRDIEDLCKAGIPIETKQGVNGGISIMEQYKMDRTLFTSAEMQDILAGLRSLDSVNGTNRYGKLMEKLLMGSSDFMVGDQSVLIDLSSWYKDSLSLKIELIRKAIDDCRELIFLYYAPKGECERRIEPYYLIFRWSSWYVWGWCEKRRDFRLFKLNRMEELCLSESTYVKRAAPMPNLSNERIFPGGIRVKALFDAGCKWRLVEEFGADSFEEQEDGHLLFKADYTDEENLITWLLSFREQVEILEPKHIRDEMVAIIRRMEEIYMASNPEFVKYVAEQLSDAGTITYRKMFGEYGMYLGGKIFALICDNQLFIKITEAGKQLAPELEMAPPYDGAKDYFLFEDVDNREFLTEFVTATWKELPMPKPKKPKKKKEGEKKDGI